MSRGGISEAKKCQHNKAELCKQSKPLVAGIQGPFKGPGSFGIFLSSNMLFLHSRDSFFSFLTPSSAPNIDENSTLIDF